MRSVWTPAPLAHLPQRRFGAQTAPSKVPVGLSRRATHHASGSMGTVQTVEEPRRDSELGSDGDDDQIVETTRTASSQSLKLPAVCTARYVSSASSPTMRRTMHRNSVARPRRPKPRVGSRSSCEILHRRRVESAGPPTG
jgi:hypothetical protein